MSALYPITLFVGVAFVWLATAVQGARLFNAFLAKYPREAQREIPYASSKMRHPEKVFFFFRSKSVPLLKPDSALWKLRQRLKLLLLLSLALRVLGFGFLAFRAITAAR
jgi:hypothetical protein